MKNLNSLFIGLAVLLAACSDNAKHDSKEYLDLSGANHSISPGENFFMYANGTWYDSIKIPPTETGIGSFYDVYRLTQRELKTILDSLSHADNPKGSVAQLVGDFYASGMDSLTIEKRGYEPLQPYFDQINQIHTPHDVLSYVASQQARNTNLLFGCYVDADEMNSKVNIAAFIQGGLGLPDRDYYFKNDPATAHIVEAYQTYLTKLFSLTGDDSITAAKKAMKVYNLEKELAGSHKTRVQLRNPHDNYHKLAVTTLDKQMPTFGWKSTLDAMRIHADSIDVSQPEFYAKLDDLLKHESIDTWKSYLKVHTIRAYAAALSSDFVNASFRYGQTVTGQDKLKPRWERIANITDRQIGEALGQLYVEKYFPPASKQQMLDLVNNLQKAFSARIDKLDWMSDATKVQAKAKLNAFLKRIGYPNQWRDYSKVEVHPDTYFENLASADRNEYEYGVNKIGKPVDRNEWGMTPPTINAGYNPVFNSITFPAGILQFPFFDPNADDAINYGGIGAAIGHEMTHGFDDQGAQYDKDGNLKNWWTPEDSIRFHEKTKAVVDLYNTFVVLDSLHVNGELTNGENIADIGGLAIAYDAFKMTPEGQSSEKINGLTPDQRFFLSFAQIWRLKRKPEYMRTIVKTNPHSPEMWRVNGTVMNQPAFYKAFDIKPGDALYRPDSTRIQIW